jgi:hypothetical protein
MNVNHHLLRSAKEEWSDWLERPDQPELLTISELRRWVKNKPPLNAFKTLAEACETMQDDIDLLNIKLAELTLELEHAKRMLVSRN